MEQAIEREDPAEVEKKIDSEKSSISGRSPSEIEDVNSRLWLSEDEAYHEAKTHPEGTREIFITFSHDDKDNPRNYSKAKKWYITCFASSLNVLTCLCAGGYSSGVEQLVDEFGVSAEVGTVGLSMYILGFAIGYVGTMCCLDGHSWHAATALCYSHLFPNTLAGTQSTFARGSFCSFSSFRLH